MSQKMRHTLFMNRNKGAGIVFQNETRSLSPCFRNNCLQAMDFFDERWQNILNKKRTYKICIEV